MKAVPLDPIGMNDRLVDALCQDLLSPQFRHDGSTPRAKAVVEIVRQRREGVRARERSGR